MKTVRQAIKYGIVGVSNTLITALVIWVMMKGLHCSDVLSNVVGYIAGVVNSFIWNKQWTFQSQAGWVSSFRIGIRYLLFPAIGMSVPAECLASH